VGSEPNAALLGGGTGGYYADSACTQELLSVPTTCASSGWFVLPQTIGNIVYKKSTTPVPTTVYLSQLDSRNNPICVAASAPAGTALVRATVEPPASFVAFTRVSVGTDPAVRVQVLQGADGSAGHVGPWHVTANQRAELRNVSGVQYVVPMVQTVSTMSRVFTACGGGGTEGFIGEDVTPRPAYIEVITIPPNGQPATTSYRAISGTQTTFCGQGQTQLENTGPGQVMYVTGTTTTPVTTFPTVNVVTDRRPGQRLVHVLSPSGALLYPRLPVLLDGRETALAIYNNTFVDAPPDAQPVQLYGNNLCTQPVTEASTPANTLFLVRPGDSASCDAWGLPYIVSSAWSTNTTGGTNRTVYSLVSGSCMSAGTVQSRFLTDVSATRLTPLRAGTP
jgi:hypothetical protein